MASIINVFLTTSVMFLLLAIAGNYLKIDVTKLGSVLFFGLIALLVGMLINMFWHNTEFNIWLNVIGIVIFSGFVVYDTAVLKQNAATPDSRIQIILAVSLFLDFINLFLMLLDLIGNNKD